MKTHTLWMVLGCGIPLLLIFFAPALGITGHNTLFAFIVLMFVIPLFISIYHDKQYYSKFDNNQKSMHNKKESNRPKQ